MLVSPKTSGVVSSDNLVSTVSADKPPRNSSMKRRTLQEHAAEASAMGLLSPSGTGIKRLQSINGGGSAEEYPAVGGAAAAASASNAGGSLSRRREELFHEAIERKSTPPPMGQARKSSISSDSGPLDERTLHVQQVLRSHFLFSGMSEADLERIGRSMQTLEVRAGDVIIEEGGQGDFFYVVESGSLEVTQKNTPGVVDVLTRDRVFGELALIYDCPRAATVRAKEHSVLRALSSVVFRELATRFMNENLQRRIAKLRVIPVFQSLTDDQLRRVSAVMQEERFAPGTEICYQGEVLIPGVNDKFYTIAEGSVMVTASGLPRRASRGVLDPLLAPKPPAIGQRRASPFATTASNGGALPPLAAVSTVHSTSTPSGTPSPSSNTDANLAASSSAVSSAVRSSSRSGLPRRSSSDSLFEDSPSRLVPLGTLGPGEWFGEIALMSNEPRSANIVALGNMGASSSDTVCFTLSRGAFEQIISPSAAQVAISGYSEARKADNHEIKMRHQRNDTAASLQLNSLNIGPVIGEGGFSVVRMCTHRESKEVFALKTMNKQDLFKRKQVLHVNNEVRILKEMSHPFILSLLKTFQDRRKVYMVLEFMQGGELFSRVLKSGGGLPPAHAQFYAACAIEGLDYLHRKRIAYRDLKLENLVIGTDGYLKIIDFGFAKQLQEGELTRTLCGTPDYLAPEAVTRQGHNHAVDCWGFGVLLYEMLTQYSPFADSTCSGNRIIVFQNIIRGVRHVDWNELARPFRTSLDRLAARGQLDPQKIKKINEEFDQVQDLLYRVWDSNPLTRASAKTIKSHPYFAAWNFSALRELSLEAPWRPEVESHSDLRYFDVDAFKNVKECDVDFEGPDDLFAEFGND